MSQEGETPVALPPVPTMTVNSILDRRDKLANYLVGFAGRQPAGDDFHGLVRTLVGMLPVGCREQAVITSAGHFAGQLVTAPAAVALAWRLAANVDRLKQGRGVIPRAWEAEPHWSGLQVLSVRPVVLYPDDKAKRQRGAYLRFQALTGLAAGLAFRRFWSIDLIRYVVTEAGFPKPWKEQAYDDERQLAGFRLAAYLEPGRAREGQPGFKHMNFPPVFLRWNKALHASRIREAAPCPRRLPLEVSCHTCPAGQDECAAACHEFTYRVAPCPRCGKDAYFDPDPEAFNVDVCVACARKIDLAILRR